MRLIKRKKNPNLKRRLIQIENKDKETFRLKWHLKQLGICPILKIDVPYDKIALDHKHKRKKDPVGVDGDGLIRGVVQIQANALEGKILNNFKRLGLDKLIDLPSFLRNLADYLENPPIPQKYIHPNEMKKKPIVSRQSFNQLSRLYSKKYPNKKRLKYTYTRSKKRKPRPNQKLTKKLIKLYDEFDLNPKFFKE